VRAVTAIWTLSDRSGARPRIPKDIGRTVSVQVKIDNGSLRAYSG